MPISAEIPDLVAALDVELATLLRLIPAQAGVAVTAEIRAPLLAESHRRHGGGEAVGRVLILERAADLDDAELDRLTESLRRLVEAIGPDKPMYTAYAGAIYGALRAEQDRRDRLYGAIRTMFEAAAGRRAEGL